MSINTTGTANTKDYHLGRGKVYFASLHPSTGLPLDYRFLGNAPEFSISVEAETLEHQSSQGGLKVTDLEVIISQKATLTLTLDEINFQNLALFFSGETATYANAVAIAGIAEGVTTLLTSEAYPVKKGVWYDLKKTDGTRLYDIDKTKLTVKSNDTNDVNTPTATLTQDTDYTVDQKMGRIFIPSTSSIVPGTTPVIFFAITADAGASVVDEVRGLTKTNVKGALKFVEENPSNSDKQSEFQFHQVSLKPSGDFSLIGDEFTSMQFTAVCEKNTLLTDTSSQIMTVRTHAFA